jgi:hypothetical protein
MNDRWKRAEDYIRSQHPLYRHYCMPEVQRAVKLSTGVQLSRVEAREIVQVIRDEKGMGPIKDYNL